MTLLIYGAGGFATELYDIIMRSMPERWEKIYFIDDFADEGECYLSEKLHLETAIEKAGDCIDEIEGIVAVGEPSAREKLAQRLEAKGIKLATIIDRTALVSPTAKIGKGTVVCEMATIHADVRIGENCIIHPYASIGHDITVGDSTVMGAHVSPGGGDVFGNRVYVGMNAVIKEKLNVGDDAIIGMGSVVFRDVEGGTTVVGNPARVTKGNPEHKVFK
jgi:sugar O-acyltransferase (sialic acid O-acetyltransferase NeuD family)